MTYLCCRADHYAAPHGTCTCRSRWCLWRSHARSACDTDARDCRCRHGLEARQHNDTSAMATLRWGQFYHSKWSATTCKIFISLHVITLCITVVHEMYVHGSDVADVTMLPHSPWCLVGSRACRSWDTWQACRQLPQCGIDKYCSLSITMTSRVHYIFVINTLVTLQIIEANEFIYWYVQSFFLR